jgi:hypothetical protein
MVFEEERLARQESNKQKLGVAIAYKVERNINPHASQPCLARIPNTVGQTRPRFSRHGSPQLLTLWNVINAVTSKSTLLFARE